MAKEQTERLSELIKDFSARAKIQVARIDGTIDHTIDDVQTASVAMKGAVLRPVREVNGLLTGIKTAVSVYALGRTRLGRQRNARRRNVHLMAGAEDAGFVDIHSHILWGTDDGSQSYEMSMAMLKIAAESGTSDIVATPHSDHHFSFDSDEVERKISYLQESHGANPVIHRGCDFHMHFDNIQDCLANSRKYTINHLRYLMVEFSDTNISKTTGQVFERMRAVDITPIITHPERNPLLLKQPELISEWVDAGCLVQVTGQSFLGRFGKLAKAGAEDLMARRMVHFVASDGHDPVDRPPVLKPAYDHVAAQWGVETARRLFIVNPRAVIAGEYLEADLPDPEPPQRKWYQFW